MNKWIVPALTGLLVVGACGGGGGDGPTTTEPPTITEPPRDERIVRLEGIVERADSLFISGENYLITTPPLPRYAIRFRPSFCGQGSCFMIEETASGAAPYDYTLEQHLANLGFDAEEIDDTVFTLGQRDGMDTLVHSSTDTLTDAGSTYDLTFEEYGFWGDHGFASIFLNTTSDTSGAGDSQIGRAVAFGDLTGSRPSVAGGGSATWSGPAEAFDTAFHDRWEGTATITMPDLTGVRVDVDIVIEGLSITPASAWNDIIVGSDGEFDSFEHTDGRVLGAFYGPDHEEIFGAFDTFLYIGVFGAKRD